MLKTLAILGLCAAGTVAWNYDDPNADWCSEAAVCCDGTTQSPIDIVATDATYKDDYMPFEFTDTYLDWIEGEVYNNGHSVQWEPLPDAPKMNFTGGPAMDECYTFAQFHFHWGSNADQGSEHTVNGEACAAEVHLVHHKCEFDGLGAALADGSPDALSVMGFFIHGGKGKGVIRNLSKKLKKLVGEPEDMKMAVAFNMGLILTPANLNDFFSYSGSLTTPTCDEAVLWIVFSDIVRANTKDLKNLRRMVDDDGNTINDNYRPVQALGARMVMRSFQLGA